MWCVTVFESPQTRSYACCLRLFLDVDGLNKISVQVLISQRDAIGLALHPSFFLPFSSSFLLFVLNSVGYGVLIRMQGVPSLVELTTACLGWDWIRMCLKR